MKFVIRTAAIVAAIAAAQPALAADGKSTGPRLEVRLGYETPTVSDGNVYKLGNSASIGAEAGYDVVLGTSIVAGPFVNYEYAESKDCAGSACLGSAGNVQVGGRLGYDFSHQGQVYVKAGYDAFRLKGTSGSLVGYKTLNGVAIALGGDMNLGKHTYVGVELDYADLGSFAGVNFQRRHAALTAGYRF